MALPEVEPYLAAVVSRVACLMLEGKLPRMLSRAQFSDGAVMLAENVFYPIYVFTV